MTNKYKQKKEIKINWKALNMCLFSLCLFTLVFYLVNINDLTVKGFSLQELKRRVNSLANQNRELEISIIAKEAYGNINQRAQELGMVAIGDIDYIVVSDEVAKK